MAQFTLDGKKVEAKEGSLVIDAAREAGTEIPHYCYHPTLGNPGNCRLCVVEVEGAPKPMVSCRLPVKEGMVVHSNSPQALRARSSALELHLVNHPLDCPVCDQAGECGLQDYYMKHGQYESQVRENKLHKKKRVPIGPHVMLDQERCVLCTRCTRFTSEVTKTHELGIFGRGHKEAIDLAPGKTLDNPYSGNVVDICPVGALTDRDFRYKVRVWYLDKTNSICPGCSRGCNISLHTNTKRPWHNEGRRAARIKPRHNAEINGYWICDEGRYSCSKLDEDRLGKVMQLKPAPAEISWDAALSEISQSLAKNIEEKGKEGLAVIASGLLSNEDWAGFKKIFVEALKVSHFLFTPEPDQMGEEDELLRKKEKVPNLKGGEALGFGTQIKSESWESLAQKIESGKIWGLYILERDPSKVWKEKTKNLLDKLELIVFQSPYKTAIGNWAHYRLPATSYAEEEGHFTNFEGKIQKYEQALLPLGEALPDWDILQKLERHYKEVQSHALTGASK